MVHDGNNYSRYEYLSSTFPFRIAGLNQLEAILCSILPVSGWFMGFNTKGQATNFTTLDLPTEAPLGTRKEKDM